MRSVKSLAWVGIGALALATVSPAALAQRGQFGGGFGPPLKAEKPPKAFATSDEHYEYLLAQAKGGTKQGVKIRNRIPG